MENGDATNPSFATPLKNGVDPAEKDMMLTALQKKKEAEGDLQEKPPLDRWNMVYLILILHGVGTLMPWNMFITANSYFVDYKLKPPDIVTAEIWGNETVNSSSPLHTAQGSGLMYRMYFLSFLGFTAQIPNLILNAFNLFCQCGGGGNISCRIIWSIITVVVMFIVTVVLAMVDSSEWPGEFFWITMVTVVIINMANGVYQNSVYGMAACLPMKYTNAVVLGSNISGTLTSVLSIISIISSPNPRTSAVYYFMAAILVLLFAFDTYFALPLIKFYRYYHGRANKIKADNVYDSKSERPPFVEIFRKTWVQDFGVWFTFFVSLTCFPAIQASVRRSDPNFFIPDKYFTGITCFLFFNLFATLGNLTTEFIRKPGPRWVWLPILLRGLFIPFFMFCNFQPSDGIRMLPVYISNDYIYMIGGILLAFTSGYFSSLTMMYAPGNVEPHHQGTAGMMAASSSSSGSSRVSPSPSPSRSSSKRWAPRLESRTEPASSGSSRVSPSPSPSTSSSKRWALRLERRTESALRRRGRSHTAAIAATCQVFKETDRHLERD